MAEKMTAHLVHRGPDDSGTWAGDDGVALAHRRLSVVDLSPTGAQPMVSGDGRWVIAYNGELYNTDELRRSLDFGSRSLRGHSDTEVLIEAIAAWGVAPTLGRAVGMFAFAAWDRHERTLWLARDRFGEKPLYYASAPDRFVFASELPALVAGLPSTPEVNRRAVAELLRHHYIPAPLSIYDGVAQLEPGSYLSVSADGVSAPTRYWDPIEVAAEAPRNPPRGCEAVDELEELLERTVRSRMVADVPLGAFLSGGIDSAAVVAMMERVRPGTRTFTIGFEDPRLDESDIARRTAAALGTHHEELIVTGRDALAVVPRLTSIYGEPFADTSQIPTHILSEFTRRSVTVALSGDGGDELFGGYERYRYFEQLLRMRRTPRTARHAAARLAEAFPTASVERVARSPMKGLVPAPLRNRAGTRTAKLARMLRSETEHDLYRTLRSVMDDADSVVKGLGECPPVSRPPIADRSGRELAMLSDTLDYLPNDILTKVDRAAMAVSLETRVPMLDPDVFRFAWSLHPDDRVRDDHGKWVLRELVARQLPREITSLPKRGFGVPIDDWLRGPLRSWTSDLIDDQLVSEQGILDSGMVRRKWNLHQSGQQNLGPELWPIVMFQAWQVDR